MRASAQTVTFAAIVAVLAIAGGLPAVALPTPQQEEAPGTPVPLLYQAPTNKAESLKQMEQLHTFQLEQLKKSGSGMGRARNAADTSDPAKQDEDDMRKVQADQEKLLRRVLDDLPAAKLPNNDKEQYSTWQACGPNWAFARGSVAPAAGVTAPNAPSNNGPTDTVKGVFASLLSGDSVSGSNSDGAIDGNGSVPPPPPPPPMDTARRNTLMCTTDSETFQTRLKLAPEVGVSLAVTPSQTLIMGNQTLTKVEEKLPSGLFCLTGVMWQGSSSGTEDGSKPVTGEDPKTD